jgi:hypothetical protein
MNFYPDDFMEGLKETINLFKQGENVFDMGNSALFPNIQKQTMWRYAQGPKSLRFTDGTHVYNFDVPEQIGEEEFLANRGGDIPITDFAGEGFKTGPAQIHRADPGSMYVTIQEGYRNPTYTLRHVGGSKWKVIPKKKAASKARAMDRMQTVIPDQAQQAVKLGMVMEFIKQAGFMDGVNKVLGKGLEGTVNHGTTGFMLPGRNPLLAAGVGAAGGLGYHLAKKHLYNTDEENAQETSSDMWRRILIPSLGLGALGTAQKSLFSATPNADGMIDKPLYYDQVRMGHTPQFITPRQ